MKRACLILLLMLPAAAESGWAANDRAHFEAAVAKLNREGAAGFSLSHLVQKEYGAASAEIDWAIKQKFGWGEIAALAYIQATTGRSFATMTQEDAREDFWAYAELAGMNCEKMAHQLEGFLKQTERERNSQIFGRLRASRRVLAMPDLGSGFGLFQEALDFRHLDSPRPTKIHTTSGILTKGEK